jgi:dimethylargininase
MAADAPRSADLFADLGHDPVAVDIGEFEKLEGSVTCLSVRLRRRVGTPWSTTQLTSAGSATIR